DFSLERCERLVDGRADNRVTEPQRRLRAQDVGAYERARRVGSSLRIQVGERGRLAWIGVVAQDRDRLCKPPRFGPKAGKAKGDPTRARARPELAQARHVRPGRSQAFSSDSVHELAQEQRIAARLFMAGSAEGVVGIWRQGATHEPGSGPDAQRSRPNHTGQRV